MNSANSWKAAVDRALGCSDRDGGLAESGEKEESKEFLFERSRFVSMEGISGRAPAVAMDPEIWSNLPFHLLESVLAWLPVSSLLKLRCVSKKFNNVLGSPGLWATRRRVLRCVPAWYLFRGEGRECAAFNPEVDGWFKLPLGFLPSSKGRVVAAAGGLLCWRQGDKMIVCNPLSKAWLELPPRKNTWKFPIVGTLTTPATLVQFLAPCSLCRSFPSHAGTISVASY
jgi:hypothetical protein